MPPCRGEGPSPFGGAVSLLLSPENESADRRGLGPLSVRFQLSKRCKLVLKADPAEAPS